MTYPPRLPDPDLDGNQPDYFDQGAFEDAAWNDGGVVGLVIALALVLGLIAVASWIDGVRPSVELHQVLSRVL